MWKMFDAMLECNECNGPLGPPPKFMIPPPPRPPALTEYTLATAHNCNEEEMALKAQQSWDNDMCEAIPILDASLYSSQSLQTSAMIAVISLLLVLVVLISSLFVWKNKRKVQNLLPCKTPTRGPHITGALGHHSAVTYEDPDAHLGHHRPLVMRHHHHHHHNVELLHGKSIHYPSGYPMTRSPPFLVSTSPGPDPYRSNDNVYEELGPSRDSDGESEPPLQSDDDFAEDELSLPGEHSFTKGLNNGEASNNVSTLYHERTHINEPANRTSNACVPERQSVLSSASSSNQDASTATAASSSSSHNNTCSTGARGGSANLLTGMLKHTTGRSRLLNPLSTTVRTKSERKLSNAGQADDLNSSLSTTVDANDLSPLQQRYDNSSNLMALGYSHQHNHHTHAHPYTHANTHRHPPSYHHSLHHMHISGNRHGPAQTPPPHFYNTIESDVERRNRINTQLKNSVAPAVATIYRERIQYPGAALQQPQYYYATNSTGGLLANSVRSRTNPRSMERRRRVVAAAPTDTLEPAYGYTEPVYHHNYHYESCNTQPGHAPPRLGQPLVYPAYIVPEYSSGSISSNGYRHTPAGTYQNSAPVYNHGDSSFGSDSGYSHHTPASSIGRHDYDVAIPSIPPAPPAPTQKPPNKLTTALSFSWHRKKSIIPSTNTITNTAKDGANRLNVQSGGNAISQTEQTEASSPNNNSGSSSLTNGLENTNTTSINISSSSCSSTGNTQNLNNNHNNNNNNNTNNNNNSNNNNSSTQQVQA